MKGREVVKPIEKIRDLLTSKEVDGIILRKRNNFSWVTEGKVNHIVNTTEFGVADLIIFQDKKICVTSKMESRRIMEEELSDLGYELKECEWYESIDDLLVTVCADKKMVTDTAICGWKDVSSELSNLRSQLSDREVEQYSILCQKAAIALEEVCYSIEPGMTELQIAGLVAAKVIPQGINPQVILVATDDRIMKYRHPIPTEKPLETYAMLVLCAETGGLVANVTRFVHFGELSSMVQENKRKLAKIDIAMNMATRPGVQVKDVFQTALNAYAEAGYPEDWRLLHQGGPTGYALREYLANMHSHAEIKENQVFAWNPAIRGIKSEDTILVGKSENTFLTHTGKWNYLEVEYKGRLYQRPDILIR